MKFALNLVVVSDGCCTVPQRLCTAKCSHCCKAPAKLDHMHAISLCQKQTQILPPVTSFMTWCHQHTVKAVIWCRLGDGELDQGAVQ